MKKVEQKRLIELLTKQAVETLNLTESKELSKLLGQQKTATNNKVKEQRDKFAKATEKAEKRAKNIIRLAIIQALEVYSDLDIDMGTKCFNVTYKAKATAKPSARNIEIKTPAAIRKRKKVVNAKAAEQKKVKSEADVVIPQTHEKVLKPLFENRSTSVALIK